MNYSISLILPCKDEAIALKSVLEKIPSQIDEVIVVDNNSLDKTRHVAQEFGAKLISENKTAKSGIGYGYALQKGIREAKGNIVVCMDGDGSYPVDKVPQIVNFLIEKNLDFISCNRLPFKDPKKMSSIRALGVKVLNLVTFILYGYRINDVLTGMWVFKRHVLENQTFTEGGWNFSLEIKLKAISSSRFSEYQIPYHDRIFDQSKQNIFRTGIEHLFYLIKFRLGILPKLAGLNLNWEK